MSGAGRDRATDPRILAVSHPLEEFVAIHHFRKCALLVGLALVLTVSPAAASNVATDAADTAQPSSGKRLAVSSSINAPGTGPVRPGEEVGLGLFVRNDGEQAENFVLTVTLPPEQTLISLEGMGVECSGTVCSGGVAPGPDRSAPDNVRQLQLRTRLSTSFRGDTTTIRTDLQQDANPEPGARTNLSAFNVQQPASGGATPDPSTNSGTGGAANSGTDASTSSGPDGMQTLPRTGDPTTITALLALCMLLLGVMAQLVGTRRPAAHGR